MGANPNIRDAEGCTSLHIAVREGCTNETLQNIINHNAYLNDQNFSGQTALWLACCSTRQGSVKFLLEAGSYPNIANNNGDTSLHAAVLGGCRRKIIRTILDHGGDVNITNKQKQTVLLLACKTRNLDIITVILKDGADPNIADDDGDTCLHNAVKIGCSKEVLQAIIERSTDVNISNKNNQTTLLLACKMRNTEATNVLLNAGANPNFVDIYGNTCLHHALRVHSNKETLQALIYHGVDVNVTNKSNQTALLLASKMKNTEAINELLNVGANTNSVDTSGDTCLLYAVRDKCNIETLQAIINHGADVNVTNKCNQTALLLACKMKIIGAINVLLTAGAEPNSADASGDTCLLNAVRENCNKETLQALIDHGAYIDARNKKNQTALLVACTMENTESMDILLNAGANPNTTDASGNTYLHNAVSKNSSKEVLQTIIDHRADANATNKSNQTALLLACKMKNTEAISVLLNAGADPNSADISGDTCLLNAVRENCDKETLQAIIDHGADLNVSNICNQTALLLACKLQNTESMNVLLNAGANSNSIDISGDTCLLNAVIERWNKETVQAIINNGADVNATNRNNQTALSLACKMKNNVAIDVLLDADANPNSADTDGDTCLHNAVSVHCNTDTLQAIIDHEADVNATNKHNWTALMMACVSGNVGAMNVLLNAGAKPNMIDGDGDTCLHNAIRKGCSKDVLQTLIDHDVDVNVTNKYGQTALFPACQKGNVDVINFLLDAGSKPNITDTYCQTALMVARKNRNADAINVLLNAGAKLNSRYVYGDNDLHKAVKQGCSKEVLQKTIDHGAEVNATNIYHETAIMIACVNRNVGAIHVLLNAGANPCMRDSNGDTYLHYAVVKHCSIDSLQALIDHGADVNATNINSTTALMMACQIGNVNAINELLNAGGKPNIADIHGDTCLHNAVRKGCRKEVLQAIIDHNADVNATNKNKHTALMIACVQRNVGAINVLLHAGAHPNCADTGLGTCLHITLNKKVSSRNDGTKETIQAIIDHGIDVNATNKDGETALMIACVKGNVDTINVLLNANANPDLANTIGNTCLHCAVRALCDCETLQAIINHSADVDATNKDRETALMIACMKGNVNAINVLLNANANPNFADTIGNTCLHCAAKALHNSETLQAIIDHGADVNSTNKDGETALMIACMKGNVYAINVLLNANANPDLANTIGNTSLHCAVRALRCCETLHAIIKHSADVDATNKDGETALMIACLEKNVDAINVLLDANANPNFADTIGYTCLHCAAKALHNRETLQAIIDHGADVNATSKNGKTALMIACLKENEDAIDILLNAGANPRSADTTGYTCLHYAMHVFPKETLKTLIDHGADVNATTKDGKTALLIACMKRNEHAINVFLNADANPSTADATGDTCLHYAVSGSCSIETLRAIIHHGADVNAINKDCQTVLMIACLMRNVDTINVLLNASANPRSVDTTGDTCLHCAFREYGWKKTPRAITDCDSDEKEDPINVFQMHYEVAGPKRFFRNECHKEVVQAIINKGADVNASNKQNKTALMMACLERNIGAINVLLNAGADPRTANIDGDTCLHIAVRTQCNKETLQAIVDHGADVNAISINNQTALMISCLMQNVDAITVLLDSRADPNIADADGNTCLHCAVKQGCNKYVCQALLNHGADVNVRNKNDQTALMMACLKANVDVINILLNAGANPKATDTDGETCLHKAVTKKGKFRMHCNKETLQAIIDHGADVNATNKEDRTALMISCMNGYIDSTNVLLNAGANPNISDADGGTCLHDAVRYNSFIHIVQRIIGHGADPNCVDTDFGTCLHITGNKNVSCRNDGTKETTETIIDHGIDVNATNKDGETALMIACLKGNVDVINVFLNANANPDLANTIGNTCLHCAVRALRHCETLQAIINHSADVDATNKDGETALMIACLEKNVDAINVLLNANANPKFADTKGNTCLHCAAGALRNSETLQAIIDHGIDVNATNKDGETALMIACLKENVDAINVLLNANANPNFADTKGNTCLHCAAGALCNSETLQAIIDHGIDVNATNKDGETALMIACLKGNVDAINVLLNANANPKFADTKGNTCLHCAAGALCNSETLQAIIDHGIDVNATNKDGETALMIACLKENVDAINVLLNANANPNFADTKGNTCLHCAAGALCNSETLQAIIDHGADVNATNKDGKTALLIACLEGNKYVIDILLNAGANPRSADTTGYTCLHYAVLVRQYVFPKETLKTFIDHGADVNAINKDGKTALLIACMKRNEHAINVFLNADANPSTADTTGDTCLHYAVSEFCSRETLQTIIHHGADVNGINKDGKTALMIACLMRNIDAIDILLNAGANPRSVDSTGDTCLHYAVRECCWKQMPQAITGYDPYEDTRNQDIRNRFWPCFSHKAAKPRKLFRRECSEEVLHAIIHKGADVNASNKQNKTALMMACLERNIAGINVLLNAGADPWTADIDGDTCLHIAVREQCNKETLQAIVYHGADVNAANKENRTSLMVSCMNGNIDSANVLLNAGANPNISDADGDTCLHYAVRHISCSHIVQRIIGHGAYVNTSNNRNQTALLLACNIGNTEAMNLLLNAGADPNMADGDDDTCLHHAVTVDCSKEILDAIIDHGADVNATNKKNQTASMIACLNGNTDAINILLHAGAELYIITDEYCDTCLFARKGCSKETLQLAMGHIRSTFEPSKA